MKHFYLLALLLILLILTSFQCTMAQNQNNFSSKQISTQHGANDYVFDLPFTEDWEYHSFTHNLWTISDDAWVIDIYTGNDGASAKFNGGSMQTNYTSTLTSNWLAGANMFVGNVTLKFDLKLNDNTQTGTEYIYIKLFNGTDYFTLDSINNTGSFDWQSHEYDISDLAFGNDFKIVFDARGSSSSNIMGWYIDNIKVYRECDPPTKLYGEPDYIIPNVFCHIEWEAPKMFIPPTSWKHWDSGENFSSVGVCDNFTVAARWDANTLNDVDGDTIKKIRYFITDTGFNHLIVHIWTGADAINTIYTDTISDAVAGTWNEHILNDTLILDASLEYWVGYDIEGMLAGLFIAGTDAGPAVVGYGDKIRVEGGTWDNLSDVGLSYNWNVQMYVQVPPDTSNHGLSHFIVYKSIDLDNDYQLLDTINFNTSQVSYEINDFDVSIEHGYYYKVNAVWAKNGDTCVSEYARAKYMPMYDYVYVEFESTSEPSSSPGTFIYPNPSANTITLKSESALSYLAIYDLTGREVYSEKIPQLKEFKIEVSTLKSGMYLLKAGTKQGVISRKIIKR